MKLFLILVFLFPLLLDGQISDWRKVELDSMTTHLPSSVRKDLEKTRKALASFARNDEEKVWLFYGYIGTWFQYDKHRKGDLNAPPLNPELTAKKGKGVCRDFSDVFRYLCVESGIPCMNVIGKSKLGIIGTVQAISKRIFHRVSMGANHQWNVAKVDGRWRLFDPTWTFYATKTYYWMGKRLEKKYIVKHVSRTYYMADPKLMQKKHAPVHPAFYLETDVPLYKKGFHRHPKLYASNYDYAAALDKMYTDPHPRFCREYINGSFHYSHLGILYHEYRKDLEQTLIKPPHPTSAYYLAKIRELQSLTDYIRDEYNVSYEDDFKDAIETLKKRNASLSKKI